VTREESLGIARRYVRRVLDEHGRLRVALVSTRWNLRRLEHNYHLSTLRAERACRERIDHLIAKLVALEEREPWLC
jgi:hypothetical protein